MSFDHLAHAVGYLDASRAAQDALRDVYADDATQQRDPKRVASLHQAINYGLKAAEVSALIGIGQQLQDLNRTQVEDRGIEFDLDPGPAVSLACRDGMHDSCFWSKADNCRCVCHGSAA